MTAPKDGDLRAGLTGLIIGAVLLGITLTVIVHFTNQKYASEAPAAAETK
ncbi:MAG TPA: hypothetical protein VGO46_00120 [Gemmatimonadaceae bacterium]|jgi:hypothetical protein|nr:hypothetical protein [Gemmatimonadaceae bacterium]